MRSAGGFNNNPTTKQFTAAYKRVLLCSTIQVGNGNCVSRNPTDILHILKDSYQGSESAVSISHAATIMKDNLLDSRPVKSDHDYTDSAFKKASISYISGYVVKMTERQLRCHTCCAALKLDKHAAEDSFLSSKTEEV